MEVNLDGEGTIILIDEVNNQGIASFPGDCLLRIPTVGEVVCYKENAYEVKK